MSKYDYDLVIVGGGPAGLAVALEAEKNGVKKILLLERDRYLGGILPQCIHNGFGLEYFKEELTGPEYAERFIKKLKDSGVEYRIETMVIKITEDKRVIGLNKKEGLMNVSARAIVLAMGCRERTREAITIPGSRPAGLFTAGAAQRYVNIEGYIPGKEVVILGSGDIGLIMARRMTLEGANVKAVLEIMPYSSGLIRNKVQCLDDFDIPLRVNHTITEIKGKKRVKSVVVSRVGEKLKPIPGTEEEIKCDTVLFSVGLIPENELSREIGIGLDNVTGGPVVNEVRETQKEGIFACGNVLQVHDLVDYVTEEGEIAGRAVKKYLDNDLQKRDEPLAIIPGQDINYVVPQHIDYIDPERKIIKIFMRVKKPMEDITIMVQNSKNEKLVSYKKDIVTPGEMVSVYLPEKFIKDEYKNLIISLQKRKEGVIDVQK